MERRSRRSDQARQALVLLCRGRQLRRRCYAPGLFENANSQQSQRLDVRARSEHSPRSTCASRSRRPAAPHLAGHAAEQGRGDLAGSGALLVPAERAAHLRARSRVGALLSAAPHFGQIEWTNPLTNRVLIEGDAGISSVAQEQRCSAQTKASRPIRHHSVSVRAAIVRVMASSPARLSGARRDANSVPGTQPSLSVNAVIHHRRARGEGRDDAPRADGRVNPASPTLPSPTGSTTACRTS